jgi:hypothetical protein
MVVVVVLVQLTTLRAVQAAAVVVAVAKLQAHNRAAQAHQIKDLQAAAVRRTNPLSEQAVVVVVLVVLEVMAQVWRAQAAVVLV